jgi:hypothetical protein
MVSHKAGPPYPFAETLLRQGNGHGFWVSVQTDLLSNGNGDADPVPCVFLVIRVFVTIRHVHKGLDKAEVVFFVVEIVKELCKCQYSFT